MTLKQIVNALKSQGHAINFRQRKDGSIVITRIDGKSYANKSGNAKARSLLGVTLTSAQRQQLEDIKTEKGKFGHKKLSALPKALKRELKNVQRHFKKLGVEAGMPTTANIRWYLTHPEEAPYSAKERLKEAERYSKGLAYSKAIEGMRRQLLENINYLREHGDKESAQRLVKIRAYLKAHAKDIKETQLAELANRIYDARRGSWKSVIADAEGIFGITYTPPKKYQ